MHLICPYCHQEIGFEPPELPPEFVPSISLCLQCGGVCVIESQSAIRLISEPEWSAVLRHPTLFAALKAAQDAIQLRLGLKNRQN